MSLDHVAITVKDLSRTVDFYSEVFGFSVLKRKEKPELGIAYAVLQAGEVTLELMAPLEGPPLRQTPVGYGMEGIATKLREEAGLNHLSIRVKDLEKTCEELRSKGVGILAELKPTGGGSKLAFITDPEGSLIELIERQ